MSCSRGRAIPDGTTRLRLFADSAGFCQNPRCLEPLFKEIEDTHLHVAEVAHIFSALDGGPRTNEKLSKEDRANYANLILLCANCHTIIDKAEEKFSDIEIRTWKESHKQKVAEVFGAVCYPDRASARAIVDPILSENKTIFTQYGPLMDQRYNPESAIAPLWKRKVLTHILPNNRKLLSIIDANRRLLTHTELEIVNLFRQHVDDFERRHLGESYMPGAKFPEAFSQIMQ